MSLFRLFIAYLLLFSISFFLLENIQDINESTGYVALSIFFVLSTLLFVLSNKYNVVLKLNSVFLPLFLFLIYFSLNFMFDNMDLTKFKAVTLGTSGGIVFSLLTGVLISFTLAVIYELSSKTRGLRKISTGMAFVFLVAVLVKAILIFLKYMGDVRIDLFLTNDQEGNYQRPAAFMFMLFMIVASLVVMKFSIKEVRVNVYLKFVFFTLLIFISIILMSTSQLIGSNSGLVTIAGFLLITLTSLLLNNKRNDLTIYKLRSLSVTKVAFSQVGLGIFKYVTITLSFIVTLFLLLFYYFEINVEQLRIFGFGDGSVSSIDSRFYLIKNNFITHLSYNPMLGNTKVDALTTGDGTYIHSSLSILTHLGIIGFLLFLLFLIYMYRDIVSKRAVLVEVNLYSNNWYKLFRLFSVSTVLIFSMFSAFYTWMPLWFCFGLLGVSLVYRSTNGVRQTNK